ncbi:MAG: BamA/TamA family outer membrane protein, partial [Halieaceae bacterium]|nr:BamA/TamA family outer membrane protein [Halieaceae bacterium]
DDFGLQSSAGVSIVGESYDIFEVLFGNLPGSAQNAIIENIGTEAYETLAPEFDAVVPGLSFKLKRADDPLYIRRGDYLNLELLGASEDLGSNIDFWQARFSSWNIWPVAERGRFLFRSDLGYTDAESRSVLGVNFNQIPEYYEFRAGGARSVRGYGWETLFPSDAITGGKHLIVASIEYEHEVFPDWSVAAFLDGGNAFNKFADFNEKLGTGIGIRWRSPVGLARIDFGIPLNDADDAFQIYITVGPEF